MICSVDIVLLTLLDEKLHLVLLNRDHEPFAGVPTLPGGYIHPEEDCDANAAAMRVLTQKTGITSPYLEQLATFSGKARDPRGWSISIAYYALVPALLIQGLFSEDKVTLQAVDNLPSLPFDHSRIVQMALERVKNKSSYSSLPVYLCGNTFTLPKLQKVYEAVLGEAINKVSFRRKIEELDILEPVEGELEEGKAHRPAQLYRLKARFYRTLSMSNRGL